MVLQARAIALIASTCVATFAMLGCQPPGVDGTPYGRDRARATAAPDGGKSKNNAPSPLRETPEATGSTSSAQQGVSLTDAGAEDETAETPTPTPTPPPPPPPTPAPPPNCQSYSLSACFGCCLDANPGAITIEDQYDACLYNCFDDVCAYACDNQHAARCNGNAACKSHHTCLQANGCFGPGA
jgi:hypothetical protein